jgi:hypothetical protein
LWVNLGNFIWQVRFALCTVGPGFVCLFWSVVCFRQLTWVVPGSRLCLRARRSWVHVCFTRAEATIWSSVLRLTTAARKAPLWGPPGRRVQENKIHTVVSSIACSVYCRCTPWSRPKLLITLENAATIVACIWR